MNKIIEWELLKPDDIEIRLATVKNGVAKMLLFQDSRCAVRALDQQFGSFGWQMDYKVVGDQIYGTLSIYDEEKQMWISKSDTGDKSNISEDKGQSSDILKRCIVRWGFATELYTSPKIEIPDDGYNNTGYRVSEIDYIGRKISHLVIVNKFGKEAFRWDLNADNNTSKPSLTLTPSKDKKTLLTEFCQAQMANGANRDELGKFYKYWMEKDFKGQMNVEKLWNLWMKKTA